MKTLKTITALSRRLMGKGAITMNDFKQDPNLAWLLNILQESEREPGDRHPIIACALLIHEPHYPKAIDKITALIPKEKLIREMDPVVPYLKNPRPEDHARIDRLLFEHKGLYFGTEYAGDESGIVLFLATLHPTLFQERLITLGMRDLRYENRSIVEFPTTLNMLSTNLERRREKVFVVIGEWNTKDFTPPKLKK